MRQFSLAIIITVLLFLNAHAQKFADPETRGVWITANYLKGGTSAIESMIRDLSAANFNVLYVNTWYRGGTLYPSDVVPKAGGPAQIDEFAGQDPLRTTIDIAHKYGMQVIAWFEYGFSVGVNTNPANIPNIIKVHPDWSMAQRDTTKRYELSEGNYFFWVDPAVPAAADFIVDLYSECAKKYPDIDGIELDRMRYPGNYYSYSYTARSRFMAETGNKDPLFLTDDNSAWTVWRRQQLTNLVKRIYTAVKTASPTVVVTGAVVPPYMMYGGDQDKLQGWDVWAKNSYVDMLEPMLYLHVSDFPYQMQRSKSFTPNGFPLSAGIAIDVSGSVDNAITEIKKAREVGATGQVLWYYGYLLSYPNAMATFKANAFQTKTSPSYDDQIIDDGSIGQFSSTGSWGVKEGGYKTTYRTVAAGGTDTAMYKVRVLRDSPYSLFGYWSGDSAGNASTAIVEVSSKTIRSIDTVNQKKGINSWNYIRRFNINSGDTVTIKIYGKGVGNIIADAFRIKRGGNFSLGDAAIPDSQSVILKFSQPLLNPASSSTSITSSLGGGNLKFSISQSDNTVLQVAIPKAAKGTSFTLSIKNLIDIYYDTLTITTNLVYDPDKSVFLIDDQTSGSFWKLAGNWFQDTSYTAEGGSLQTAKQKNGVTRVQWGPVKVIESGYYEVFVNIPKSSYPLSEKCMYFLKDHFKYDTVYISQASVMGSVVRLGAFPFSASDVFSLVMSSVLNNDTTKYLVADAVVLKRSVDMTAVKENNIAVKNYNVSQNYPNPFNPATTIDFELTGKAAVTINVFNILGQKVASLVDGKEYAPGRWNVRFDASLLSSGVYLAQIRFKNNTAESNKIIKMVLMK